LQQAAASGKDFPGKAEAGQRLKTLGIDVKTANGTVVNDLETRIRQEPKDIVALKKLGAIQERDGVLEKAAKTYEGVLKQNPQNVEVIGRLAKLYDEHLNERSKALELAKQAHNIAPEDASMTHLLGRLAYETSDYKWALSLLQEAARKLPEPRVQFDLAWAHYGVGHVEQGEAGLKSLVQSANSNVQLDAQEFLAMIDAAKSQATAKEAAEQARQILTKKPNYIPAIMVSALSKEAEGEWEKAKRTYETILAGAPSFAPAAINLALLCAEHFGDDPKAYEVAMNAHEAYPEDPRVGRALGILAYRRAKGREDFAKCAQLLKTSALTLKNDAELMYYLGMAQYQIKDNECKKSLERALALNVEPRLADQAKRAIAEMN